MTPFMVTFLANLAYGPLPAQTLDACLPPRPVASTLIIHGGGWSGGDKTQFDNLCLKFASRGIAAFTINYRLAPAAYWPAQGQDVSLAAQWVQAHYPSGHLCSLGYSAGAQLSAYLGVLRQVSCAATISAPTNLVTLPDRAMVKNLIGPHGLRAEESASPLDLLSGPAAPFLIIQGLADTTVPPSQALALTKALKAQGSPVSLRLNSGGHVLIGLTRAQKDQVDDLIERFIRN